MITQELANEIVINLTNSSDALLLDEKQLFQRQALHDLKEKIQKHLDRNEIKTSREADSYYERSHNTITISGGRGSGKTTFLLNALSTIKKDNKLPIVNLRIIDPTLISTKEHVLVIIISLIKKEIDVLNTSSNNEDAIKQWRDSLRKLAGGLCQIDGIGPDKLYGDDWDDKTYILEKGLEKAREGFEFEQNFNNFLDLSLKIINKKAFIVVFDDIDTKFESGWPVLESIRKYLTSPLLITIISGDIDLYSTLIRRAQFQNFGELSLKYDRPSSEFHTNKSSWHSDLLMQQIARLEDQFLMKILKPENRIAIQSLNTIESTKKYPFRVTFVLGEESYHETLKEYLSKIFKIGLGIQSRSDLNAFSTAILQLPTRTVWQFLKAGELLRGNEPDRRAFSMQVTQIFAASLFKANVNPDVLDFKQNDLSQGIGALWSWAIESGKWEEVYRLYPEFLDSMENQRAITFGIYFSAMLNDFPSSVFEFMVKAGWARELLLQNQNKEQDARKILIYLGLDRREKTLLSHVAESFCKEPVHQD